MRNKKIHIGRYLIYGLLDPRDNSLKYVGKTHKRRENRLADHIEDAIEGSTAPVHNWIRELLSIDLEPMVFVLKRLEASENWRVGERKEIVRWNNWPSDKLPYLHPPQTRKSVPVKIEYVDLLNVIHC